MSPSKFEVKMARRPPFKVATLLGNDTWSETATSCIRRVLGTIQQYRPRYSFEVTNPVAHWSQTAIGQPVSTLPLEVLHACEASDAIISLGRKQHSELYQKLQLEIDARRFCFTYNPEVGRSNPEVEDFNYVDATFLHSNFDKTVPGRDSSTPEYLQRIQRLVSIAVKLSKRHNSVLPINILSDTTKGACESAWLTTVCEVFSRDFPDSQVTVLTVGPDSGKPVHNLAALTGVIVSSDSRDQEFLQAFESAIGSQIYFPSIFRSSPQGSELVNGRPTIYEPFDSGTSVTDHNAIGLAQAVADMLEICLGLTAEASALSEALRRTLDPVEYVGSNMRPRNLGGVTSDEDFFSKLLENLELYLETLNSLDLANAVNMPRTATNKSHSARPMGVIEKILTHSAIGLETPEVTTGQMICVAVDWTITSELLWGGMVKTYDSMKRPRPYRNDRIWLAVDHTVDPRTIDLPKQKKLMATSEVFRDEAKLISYLPANTSIMHTDFTREKAQPGRVVVGSDSHTCSSGSMGSFAVGFGAADVVMPLVTGETWFRVPQVCRINFVGTLQYGISGKDVILHILHLFKRNTIAFQRAVEYGGPSLGELSMDARFAIANMTTEFGAMGACFEADDVTATWIAKRRSLNDRKRGIYFRPDPAAEYAEVRSIDLSEVALTMALYPNPDNVVRVADKAGMKLDGCFIGACTTTEEELILAALVLEAGLRSGLQPSTRGKRRTTPGSLIIIKRLEKLGLIDIYEQAGFEIGAPGCSYCVGINDVDVAGEGEVWLSSQNRNFRNRMGKGSFGNITSAAAVAASSFNMTVTDPTQLLNLIDKEKLQRLIKGWRNDKRSEMPALQEPAPRLLASQIQSHETSQHQNGAGSTHDGRIITSRIQRFGGNVDTDAVIPAEFMPGVDNADLGSHCFEYFRPEFRDRVRAGSKFIVAEQGFGSGSSREDAVRALLGSGVQAVIAKSFAFIYERNQLNMGLFNVVLQDDDFYRYADEGRTLTIDKGTRTLTLEGIDKVWQYSHSQVEDTLLSAGGILNLYNVHGRSVFREIIKQHPNKPSAMDIQETSASAFENLASTPKAALAW